ncbi:homeobox protein NANOG-like [Gracilinanus agilis]|uniref:homeobox protein NANOG-like n=1 Tax=Gracilinanus agilis TaxID=191870 RepID=UPI001CFEF04C|nr:homeobox protein NANOG-like [Gracilinanus agilis]
MEHSHDASSAGALNPSASDLGPPGAEGGTLPNTEAEPLPQMAESNTSPSLGRSASSPAPSSVDPLVPDTLNSSASPEPQVQEGKISQSYASKGTTRTKFSEEQLRVLKACFQESKYINKKKNLQLAEQLGLSRRQIWKWFQQWRLKLKKNPQLEVVGPKPGQRHRLPRLKPAVGPQDLGLPSSFLGDPMCDHPKAYPERSCQVSENCLWNCGEAHHPFQVAPQASHPACTSRSQAYVASSTPPVPPTQAPPPHLPTRSPGNLVQLEKSSDCAEASDAPKPSLEDSHAP